MAVPSAVICTGRITTVTPAERTAYYIGGTGVLGADHQGRLEREDAFGGELALIANLRQRQRFGRIKRSYRPQLKYIATKTQREDRFGNVAVERNDAADIGDFDVSAAGVGHRCRQYGLGGHRRGVFGVRVRPTDQTSQHAGGGERTDECGTTSQLSVFTTGSPFGQARSCPFSAPGRTRYTERARPFVRERIARYRCHGAREKLATLGPALCRPDLFQRLRSIPLPYERSFQFDSRISRPVIPASLADNTRRSAGSVTPPTDS